ncbi:MAG: hypothetical protein NVS2B12_13930 [Ktedonobacteraceae bacterium]
MTVEIVVLSPSQVGQQFNDDARYSIIDARPYADFVAGHIPGAVWMGWEDWCAPAPAHAGQTLAQPGYWGALKEHSSGELQEPLRQLGLSNECPVLVYANGVRSMGREARVAWMLLYWGLASVSLLSGGWSAWLSLGGVSETATVLPSYGNFTIQVQPARRIQLDQLKQHLANTTMPILIDTRSQAEFSGYKNSYQPRLGRLPGSIHIPYTDFFDEASYFVTRSVYLQRLPQEVSNGKHFVGCCEVGIRSCLFALLHEAYTGQVVANYDGAVMEWALTRELPMECDNPL